MELEYRVICKHCGIDYPAAEYQGTPAFCCRFCWEGIPGEARDHHRVATRVEKYVQNEHIILREEA